jgi:hypothetical protein
MAFAVHRTGERAERDAVGGVYTLGPFDTWLPRENEAPQQSHDAAHVLSAAQREELVDAFYKEQRRSRTQIADGVGTSMTD